MYDPTVQSPKTREQLCSYVLLYGFFAVLGAAGLTCFLMLFIWPQWRVNHSFVEADGLVVDEREHSGEGGKFRQVLLRYSVDGADVEHWSSEVTLGMDEGRIQQQTRAMAVGERYPVWYDPANPEVVVVQRGYWIHWMLYPVVVGLGFFFLYGVGKITAGVRAFTRHRRESVRAAGEAGRGGDSRIVGANIR